MAVVDKADEEAGRVDERSARRPISAAATWESLPSRPRRRRNCRDSAGHVPGGPCSTAPT